MTLRLSRTLTVAASAVVFIASLVVLNRSYAIYKSTTKVTIEREPAVKEAEGETKAPTNDSVQFDLDEVLSDLAPSADLSNHSLQVHLELELFDSEDRTVIEKAAGGLKDTIVTLIGQETVSSLSSLSGKLYFKETLVARMNTFLNQPVVRDIHFSSFLIK